MLLPFLTLADMQLPEGLVSSIIVTHHDETVMAIAQNPLQERAVFGWEWTKGEVNFHPAALRAVVWVLYCSSYRGAHMVHRGMHGC